MMFDNKHSCAQNIQSTIRYIGYYNTVYGIDDIRLWKISEII